MFKISASFEITNAQKQAVDQVVQSVEKNKFTTLLGVTGSGKTFVMAKIIEKLQKPALIISHNKILASQLFGEFKNFFPNNQVEFFISYYDFYRPEAYIPQQDIYIEKEAIINAVIDKLRHRATQAAISNPYSIIVSSVSCIYNLGSPEAYQESFINVYKNQKLDITEFTKKLVSIYYENSETDFKQGNFMVRGNTIYIFPSGEDEILRIDLEGDYVSKLFLVEPISYKRKSELDFFTIYPAKLFVSSQENIIKAIEQIRTDLEQRYEELVKEGKLIEAERLKTRVEYDIAMLSKFGTCPGIENYSRYLSGRQPGSTPYTLLDYFSSDFIVFIDESHVTVPQLKAMYKSDRNRKETLVEYGFRLPSCLDNRPLRFEEFLEKTNRIVFVSATPGDFELSNSHIVELLVRPSGIVDPEIIVKPNEDIVKQIIDISLEEKTKNNRVIVNVLTQKIAEDLSQYLTLNSVSSTFLHSKVKPLDRVKILFDFRKGVYDVIVGVNLLREGLDLPEVSVVIITDGDKQGFLRSKNSIIQLAGRAARNKTSKVIIFTDKITPAIKAAIEEVDRRRKYQIQYNLENNITPTSIPPKPKDILKIVFQLIGKDNSLLTVKDIAYLDDEEFIKYLHSISKKQINELKKNLKIQMKELADNMEFEQAIIIREKIKIIESMEYNLSIH
ncbi:MAG: excinuclease ABC subunit UvrB [Candidatus Calescibacterium sp.]|nr:excinuclease ABC subunit UvrB [Candidatus Calescibacterium sp.]MDW8195332.1 excinuclease ABC subunit UvrB [Candidatus Calescibacterium sp.]